MRLTSTKLLLFLVVLSILQASCVSVSRRRVIPEELRLLPVQTISRMGLIERLTERSKAVQSLTATVAMDASGGALTTGVLTEYRQTRGFVLVERPSQIRIRAQAPLALATVFDMVSDGEKYRVSIPVRNKFLLGDTHSPAQSDNPMLNLRPQHILEALFLNVEEHLDNGYVRTTLEETTVGRNSYYVFYFIDIAEPDAELLEKLWIDRSTLEVARKQIFDGDGRVETDVEFSDYFLVAGTPFPHVIVIHRPVEDYTLKLTFQRTTLNEPHSPDSFVLERPAGAELVLLNP